MIAATTPVRVVCQNTLNWGLERARQRFSIRHTEQISRRVHEARRVLELSIDYYAQFKATGNLLASERCTERQLQRVLDELYPSGTEDRMTDRTRKGRERTKQRIVELFLHGDTQGNAPGASGRRSTRSWSTATGTARSARAGSGSPARSMTVRRRPGRSS